MFVRSRNAVAACLATFALAGSAPAETVSMPGMSMKETVSAWLRTNIDTEGDAAFLGKIESFLHERVDANDDVILDLGPGTINANEGTRLVLFAGQLFSLALSPAQSMQLLEKPTSVSARHFKPNYVIAPQQTLEIGLLTLDSGNSVAGSAKVTGKIAIKTTGTPPAKLALRMVVRINEVTSQRFYWLQERPAEGLSLATFSYDPINEEGEKPYAGPVVLAFDVCTIDETGGGVDIKSHSNGIVIDVDVK